MIAEPEVCESPDVLAQRLVLAPHLLSLAFGQHLYMMMWDE